MKTEKVEVAKRVLEKVAQMPFEELDFMAGYMVGIQSERSRINEKLKKATQ